MFKMGCKIYKLIFDYPSSPGYKYGNFDKILLQY